MVKRLDSVDMAILENLQKNGRMTNVELAYRAGISAPPCLRRLKNLEESGVIVGYHADINGALTGYNFLSLCLISLINQGQECTQEFLDYIQRLDNVRECFSITGDYDYIMKVVAKDLADYENFLSHNLKKLSNIRQIKTYITIQNNKYHAGVPCSVSKSEYR